MFLYIIILIVKGGVLLPTNLLFKVDKHLTDSPICPDDVLDWSHWMPSSWGVGFFSNFV